MHSFLKRALRTVGTGGTAPSSALPGGANRPALEALEDRYLPSGFNSVWLGHTVPDLRIASPNLVGKSVVLADPGGNSVGTVHINMEDAYGNFTGTFDSSVFHLKDGSGNSESVPISGVVGPGLWRLGFGGWFYGPGISFQGSATGSVSSFADDTETVSFQGALSSNGSTTFMGGTFDESDLFMTILGNTTSHTHADVSGALM